MANYVEIGNNYCRGPGGDSDYLKKRNFNGISSDASCRNLCDAIIQNEARCTGYHWQKDERCIVFFGRAPEKVKQRGRDKGTCWKKLPQEEVACENWCYEEFDCIGEHSEEECGDCDMPACPVTSVCEPWCYQEVDCIGEHSKWWCGGCDLPDCQEQQQRRAQAPSSTGESFGESVRRLQGVGHPPCGVEGLKGKAEFMHDLTTCEDLITKYIQYAVQGIHIPDCASGTSFVNHDGTCDDHKVVETARILQEKYEAARKAYEAEEAARKEAERKDAARKALGNLCEDWCDPECRDNECCGGHESCMGCAIPGCGPSASACEDWCDPECRDNECCGGHESCLGCPIPGCSA